MESRVCVYICVCVYMCVPVRMCEYIIVNESVYVVSIYWAVSEPNVCSIKPHQYEV